MIEIIISENDDNDGRPLTCFNIIWVTCITSSGGPCGVPDIMDDDGRALLEED